MAKKKKKKDKRKYRYTTGDRVDMRTGGRVKAQRGGLRRDSVGSGENDAQTKPKNKPINAEGPSLRKPINAELPPKPTNKPISAEGPSLQSINQSEDIVTGGPVGPGVPFTTSSEDDKVSTTGTQQNGDDDTTGSQPPPQQDPPGDQTDDTEKNGDDDNQEDDDTQENDGPQIGDTKEEKGILYEWQDTDGDGVGDKWVIIINEDKKKDTQEIDEEKARQQQLARESAEAAARGEVPDAAKLPDAEQVGFQRDANGELILDEDGNPIPIAEQQVTEMDEPTKVGQQEDVTTTKEKVTTGTAETAETPEERAASTFTAKEVEEEVDVEAAEKDKEDLKLAEAAEVDDVAPIEGADVEIEDGALAERVVGEISKDAKAKAAKNAGTSLAKITRAKKQLRNAGLSEEEIAAIGNDIEDLEARLTDFTEEQRGIIAGLPEEALVSTQLNGLLEGMENGEIPPWASPAVAAVEQMLAARGLSASTVGRDALFNAIIQSAMPIAQSNAQALQQSVAQQKDIEARADEANAQRQQQVGLQNAQNVFNMNMAQFNADQQTELSNSKFMQTVSLTNASNDQQAAVQNAVLASQRNIAEANLQQQAEITNAQNFLKIDLANLNNEQQANVLEAQLSQQRILSNQAAVNASKQFNATNEQQMNQFTMNLAAQTEQFNKSQLNAMEQFNATQANAAEARDANRAVDVQKFNNQLAAQIDEFNSNQDFARNQWNAQNRAIVEQSNTQWRRQVNTANTAMQNQINAQNAQNAFAMTQTAQSFLWQELRDQADYDFRSSENERNRISALVNTALASDPEKYGSSVNDIKTLISLLISGTS